MAVTRINTSSFTSLNKYDVAAADNNYMETIASTSVGAGGTSTITFSDIPQGYLHLQIRSIGRSTTTVETTSLRFNSDTSASYSRHYMYGSHSTGPFAGSSTSSTSIIDPFAQPSSGFIANTFGVTILDILDYSNSNKNKTTRSFAGNEHNTVGYMFINSGLWMNTSPITSITITAGASFAQYSRFSLYGIKG